MAWCGAAQKECGFLDNMIETRDKLRDEASKTFDPVVGDELEKLMYAADQVIGWTKSPETAKCNEEICAINAVANLIKAPGE